MTQTIAFCADCCIRVTALLEYLDLAQAPLAPPLPPPSAAYVLRLPCAIRYAQNILSSGITQLCMHVVVRSLLILNVSLDLTVVAHPTLLGNAGILNYPAVGVGQEMVL